MEQAQISGFIDEFGSTEKAVFDAITATDEAPA